jgi:hypothetical protein
MCRVCLTKQVWSKKKVKESLFFFRFVDKKTRLSGRCYMSGTAFHLFILLHRVLQLGCFRVPTFSTTSFQLTRSLMDCVQLIIAIIIKSSLSRYSDWLRAGRSGDRIPVGARFSPPVQTGPGTHPVSCTMGTGSFPGVESGRGVMLTPHPLLVPRSKTE